MGKIKHYSLFPATGVSLRQMVRLDLLLPPLRRSWNMRW